VVELPYGDWNTDTQDSTNIDIQGDTFTLASAIPDSVVDDFEDGDLNGWSGDTSYLSNVTQTNSGVTSFGEGDRFGEFANSDSNNIAVEKTFSSGAYSTVSNSHLMLENSNSSQYADFNWKDGGTEVINIQINVGNTPVQVNTVNTSLSSQNGTNYNIEIKNIDYSAETFDVFINESEELSAVSFTNPANSLDTFEVYWSGGGSGAYSYHDYAYAND
jgi:hypothetical protein